MYYIAELETVNSHPYRKCCLGKYKSCSNIVSMSRELLPERETSRRAFGDGDERNGQRKLRENLYKLIFKALRREKDWLHSLKPLTWKTRANMDDSFDSDDDAAFEAAFDIELAAMPDFSDEESDTEREEDLEFEAKKSEKGLNPKSPDGTQECAGRIFFLPSARLEWQMKNVF